MPRFAPALLVGSLLVAAPSFALADDATVSSAMSTSEPAPQVLGWARSPSIDGRPITIRQAIPPQPTLTRTRAVRAGATGAAWVIYMNRDGGTYTPGGNDSRTNRSSIAGQTSQITAWNVSDAGWAEVMSCIRNIYAPYDVEITDVDPGNVPHIESVVAGRPEQILAADEAQGVGGISPFTTDCGVIDNSIVYTFADIYGTDYETVCEVVAQETAHSFGLDHEFLKTDPMTYLDFDGLKSFQDQDVSCGEFSARACGLPNFPSCRPSQNSVELLRARIGSGDAVAPTVSIASPADGSTVPPGFTVVSSATDNVGVTKVELWIDDTLVATDTTSPYEFTTAASLADGSHDIETRAYDAKNAVADAISIEVRTGADPLDPSDPTDPRNGGGDDGGGDDGATDPTDPSGNITGGCSTGGAAGGGAAGLLGLALASIVTRRRRS